MKERAEEERREKRNKLREKKRGLQNAARRGQAAWQVSGGDFHVYLWLRVK